MAIFNVNAALATRVDFFFRENNEVQLIWAAYDSQGDLIALPDYAPVWTWHNLYRKDDIFLQYRIGTGFTVMPDGKRLSCVLNKNTMQRRQCAHFVRFQDLFDIKSGVVNIADYNAHRIDADTGQIMSDGSTLRIDVVGNVQVEGSGAPVEINTETFANMIGQGVYEVTPDTEP